MSMLSVLIILGMFTAPIFCQRNGKMRLAGTGSSTGTQGRVEMYYKGAWGTVCDDNFGIEEVAVVCRYFGFNDVSQFSARPQAAYGAGTGSILLDDLSCTGAEKRLLDCVHLPVNTSDCSHAEDAGVLCTLPGDDGCMNSPLCAVLAVNCIYGVTEIVKVPNKRCPVCRCASCPATPKCPPNCKSGKTEYYQGVFCRRCRCVPQVIPDVVYEPNNIPVGLMAAVTSVAIALPLVCLTVALLYWKKFQDKKKAREAAQKAKDNSKQQRGATGENPNWFAGDAEVTDQPQLIDIM